MRVVDVYSDWAQSFQHQWQLPSPISISGLVSLDERQTSMLEALGLEVPEVMTKEQLAGLVGSADQIAASMTNEMIAGMTESELAELKFCFGLT